MTRFVESPVPYLLLGLAAESILLILYLQTRRAAFMTVMFAIALLVAGGIAVEQFVVTDREAIETAVYDLAAAAEANDVAAVLGHISPQAAPALRSAERELSRYKLTLARVIGRPEIEILGRTSPPTARVRFPAIVKVKDSRDGMESGARLEFVLTYTRENDRWLLLAYTYKVH